MKILIAYATTDGTTARIAARIAETARAAGSDADVVDTGAIPEGFDPTRYDGILVGASMHARGYQRSATRFVRRNKDLLAARPSGFFSVCLSIVSKRPEDRAAARRIAEHFPRTQSWKPDVIEIVAGALSFSRYGLFRRAAMKFIAEKEMGSVDASRDTIFTDWTAVDRFARDFVRRVAERASATTAPASV